MYYYIHLPMLSSSDTSNCYTPLPRLLLGALNDVAMCLSVCLSHAHSSTTTPF